jgi:protein-L-isoaspartate(D-aspartate) O-methyltransferase
MPTASEDLTGILRSAGIHEERLLGALRRVPRAAFVPPEASHRAHEDVPLPIPHGQVTTQPSLLTLMVQALELRGEERMLEIGTGLGFQTAILASLCREVVSIEWFADLAAQARANLEVAGIATSAWSWETGRLGCRGERPTTVSWSLLRHHRSAHRWSRSLLRADGWSSHLAEATTSTSPRSSSERVSWSSERP